MSFYRAQISAQPKTGDPGRDWITNVMTFRADTTPASSIGAALQSAFGGGVYNHVVAMTTKVYDMSLPLHSPPVFTSTTAPGAGDILGPRQIALCLSWYAGLNVKGMRGRIYIGPWPQANVGEYATTAQMASLIALGGLLHHPGGPDVVHTVHHVASGTHSDVTNYFCNNRWDTMRSRLPKETARQVST